MLTDTLDTTIEQAEDNPERLKALHQKPAIAWPTIGIMLAALVVIAYLIVAVTAGWMNPYIAAIPGGIAGYFIFTPMHESIHRSASSKEWLNTLVASTILTILLPYVSYKLLRWGHMQHHRFTNEVGKDPDRLLTNHWYGPLLLWPFFELFYLPQYLRVANTRPQGEVRQVLLRFPVGIAILGTLIWFAGIHLFIFWFLASRLGLWLIVLVFVYLPHHPHDTLQKDDMYGATSMREGSEWLLTVLMAGQNHHLVHHLYPTIPFYRMKKAWLARKAFHEANRPARVKGLSLKVRRDEK